MRTLLRALAGALLVLLGCELLLRLLPGPTATFSGRYLDPLIVSYPPHIDWVSATGWDLRNAHHNPTNSDGFVGTRDFRPDPQAVGLIGDSFIEAAMLPLAERPAAQLERALGTRAVHGMGMPGSSLLDYAERMRWAQARYGLRDFVLLLETGDLRQALCGSGNVQGVCLDPQTLAPRDPPPSEPPGLAKRLLRHSALAQYLFGQLNLSPQRLWQQALQQARPPAEPGAAPPAQGPAVVPDTPHAQAVTEAFLARIAVLKPRRLVIVLDTARAALYAGQPRRLEDLQAFAARARAAGIEIVDADPIFARHFAEHGLRFDVDPYDRHLNALGIGLLMQAAARQLDAAPPR